TKKGRIECVNYRTVSLPTSKNIPLFVKDNFGTFYSNLYQHQWKKEGKSVAMLEYAWDVSPKNFMKCDPCVATAPSQQDLLQAGVWWMDPEKSNASDIYSGSVYFTRLHVRYNRKSFPQDLVFQTTPNTDNFQSRYIVTHPATGDLSCPAGKEYVKGLKERRSNEMEMLNYLTGKGYNDWDMNAADGEVYAPSEASYQSVAKAVNKEGGNNTMLVVTISAAGILMLAGFRKKIK
ncbi:MAG: hypothetical protein JWR72_873, partial [Flavisolibacter sp.]|nr:hypothetical protein [Flavisolibacter sp.]